MSRPSYVRSPRLLALTAALVGTALSGCTARPTPADTAVPALEPPLPMTPFARLVGGEWRVTFASGDTASHAWRWGPGRHSLRQQANSSTFAENPWAGEVIYWHPGRREVCVLSLHGDIPAIGRGVSEGTIWAEGDVDVGAAVLYQPNARRTLGLRRTFATPDRYHEELLEDSGGGRQPLNAWDFVRVPARTTTSPGEAHATPSTLPNHLAYFEHLLGSRWEAKGQLGDGDEATAFHTISTVELIPSLEVLRVRVSAADQQGERAELIDAYIYRHVATQELRCLALSRSGGVFEGTISPFMGGALQGNLTAYEGDRREAMVVWLLPEADGVWRCEISSGPRGWSSPFGTKVVQRPVP